MLSHKFEFTLYACDQADSITYSFTNKTRFYRNVNKYKDTVEKF